MSATIRPVPRARGTLTTKQLIRLEVLHAELREAETAYREAVVRTLEQGASFSEVSKATGLSTNTLQRWKREAS